MMNSWLTLDLLTVSTGAAVAMLVGLLGLVLQSQGRAGRKARASSGKNFAGIGLFGALALLGLGGLVLGLPAWLCRGCLGVLAVGAILVLVRLVCLVPVGALVGRWLGHPASLWIGLFLVGIGTLLAQVSMLEQEVGPLWDHEELTALSSVEGALEPVETQWAVTDAGRSIRLFTVSQDRFTLPTDVDTTFMMRRHFEQTVIQTDEANTRYNCHGWVFTGGRFWVRGSFVETILKDNGYQSTSTPEVGDVVVYRENSTGQVAHTGLIRAVLAADGPETSQKTSRVLIESKMGVLGRFIHEVDTHPYDNTTYQCYHTSRESHILHGLDGVRRPDLGKNLAASGGAGKAPEDVPTVVQVVTFPATAQ
jgi:hypothetical protein